MARILVVEDEKSILEVVTLNLELDGHEVVVATTGKKAVDIFGGQRFDLIILDVMLPEMNGFDVCEKIRLTNTEIPILFLTARDLVEDKIQGLKSGGDDYLVKPFHLEEFLLRVKSLLKRVPTESIQKTHIVTFGNNTVDFSSFEAFTYAGNKLQLTSREASLLRLLVHKKNQVVSRNEIMEKVWEYDVFPSSRTIDNFIVNFRKHFEQDSRNPRHFHSVRGVGYKFIE